MRRAGRTDSNQREVVEALRRVGAAVSVTSGVGDGFPDLLVGYRGETWMLELKDGAKPPSARQLTEAERYFIEHWKGRPVVVVKSAEEALAAIGAT